ncbi:MAG: hypothetical protein N4A71_03610 [Carboxylicivirga sp.]|nr:hypothetical protein [Carboxylicivirga sp.]
MNKVYFISCLLIVLTACHDMKVGFLEADQAGYIEDLMVVKHELTDTLGRGFHKIDGEWVYISTDGADYHQHKFGAPWVSTQVDGILGTKPIFINLKSVSSTAGDAGVERFNDVVEVRGDGAVIVPVKHDLPLGDYTISLKISNQDHQYDLDNVFTLRVIQK